MTDEHDSNELLLLVGSSPQQEALREANISAMVAMADYLVGEAREISAPAALFLLLARHELKTKALERSGLIVRLLGGKNGLSESEGQRRAL
jgi:hypothetical protein